MKSVVWRSGLGALLVPSFGCHPDVRKGLAEQQPHIEAPGGGERHPEAPHWGARFFLRQNDNEAMSPSMEAFASITRRTGLGPLR